MSEKLKFYVNDQLIEESKVSPTTTLLKYLRENLGLTATKEGCAEGDCGACSVVILDPDGPEGPLYRTVNSCLVMLPMIQGKKVYTAEGIGDGKSLHPAQQAIIDHYASQCGFCTPGIAMSLFEATYRQDINAQDLDQIEEQLAGNLCRCTGYRPIRDAGQAVAGLTPKDRFWEQLVSPQDNRLLEADQSLSYRVENQVFYMPKTEEELWELLDRHPKAYLVNGGTDLSLKVSKSFEVLPTIISLEGLKSWKKIQALESGGWRIGAGIHLTDLEKFARRSIPMMARMLRYFGSRQIKHRATLGGNLCNASPIGDLPPVLLALDAVLIIASQKGERRLNIASFFKDYRKTDLKQGEVLKAIEIPELKSNTRASAYKISKRRELDISTLSGAFWVQLNSEQKVQDIRLAFGGMAAIPRRAYLLEEALEGKTWSEEVLSQYIRLLDEDFQPIDDHRGSAWYRRTVAKNLIMEFYFDTLEEAFPNLTKYQSLKMDIDSVQEVK